MLVAAGALAQGDAEPGRAFDLDEGGSPIVASRAAPPVYALIGFEKSVGASAPLAT